MDVNHLCFFPFSLFLSIIYLSATVRWIHLPHRVSPPHHHHHWYLTGFFFLFCLQIWEKQWWNMKEVVWWNRQWRRRWRRRSTQKPHGIQKFSRRLAIPDFHQAGHCLRRSSSMLVYAWPSGQTYGSSSTHHPVHTGYELLWSSNLQDKPKHTISIHWRKLGWMPRHSTLNFWLCHLPWRQSNLVVFKTPTNCLQVKCWGRIQGDCQRRCWNLLLTQLIAWTTLPSSHCYIGVLR